MLPVVTLNVFGLKRGDEVYGYMYASFGVAAISGLFFVETCQDSLGYDGMLYICLCISIIAGIAAMTYNFKEQFDYLSVYIKKDPDAQLELEKAKLNQDDDEKS